MKKSAFKITIPEPCHENWQAMTPEAKGRFCQKCAKTVHDFSNKTDRHIAKVYQENEGKVCGRFHKRQLNRRIAPYEPAPKVRHWTVAGMILSGILAVGQLEGQNCSSNIKGEMVLMNRERTESIVMGKFAPIAPPITITGQLTDNDGAPLEKAFVRVIGANIQGFTDAEGQYKLKFPGDYIHQVKHKK